MMITDKEPYLETRVMCIRNWNECLAELCSDKSVLLGGLNLMIMDYFILKEISILMPNKETNEAYTIFETSGWGREDKTFL